jgi:hypothetical protein
VQLSPTRRQGMHIRCSILLSAVSRDHIFRCTIPALDPYEQRSLPIVLGGRQFL